MDEHQPKPYKVPIQGLLGLLVYSLYEKNRAEKVRLLCSLQNAVFDTVLRSSARTILIAISSIIYLCGCIWFVAYPDCLGRSRIYTSYMPRSATTRHSGGVDDVES